MIVLRRNNERHHVRRRKHDVWLTFEPKNRTDSFANGFIALENFKENRFPPGASVQLDLQNGGDVITYVLEGTLAQKDSTGRSGVINTGEFQRLTAGRGVRRSETNASRTGFTHFFQIWLRPSRPGLETSYEQKRFSEAQRRGLLCVVVSPDGREGSLCVHRNALIYSSILDPGQHLVHELRQGRSAWLHVVRGDAALDDLVLATGDGAGVTAEIAVSLTAREKTEILLVDLGE
jgi:redox-sensitive bicupin YhaK (pirin superfamily)